MRPGSGYAKRARRAGPWRHEDQARRLIEALTALDTTTPLARMLLEP